MSKSRSPHPSRKKQRSAYNESDSTSTPQESDRRSSDATQLTTSPRLRAVLSLIVIFQLLAVWAEPFRFFTLSSRGTSPASDPARQLLSPYIEFAFLNHGYFFFAPEPGPSHLIEAKLVDDLGKSSTVRYPDRRAQWPRLLYHRHFMLTENLHQLWIEPFEPIEEDISALPPEEQNYLAEWRSTRQRFEMVRDSMADHLAHRFGANEVTIGRIEHRLPSDIEVFSQHMRLNDARLYIPLPDSLPLDALPPSGLPPAQLDWQTNPAGVPPTGLFPNEPIDLAPGATEPEEPIAEPKQPIGDGSEPHQ